MKTPFFNQDRLIQRGPGGPLGMERVPVDGRCFAHAGDDVRGAGRRDLISGLLVAVVFLCTACDAPVVTDTGRVETAPCAVEWDYALDGSVNYRKTFDYGPEGRLVAERWDQRADGVYERERFYHYGADGVEIEERWDLDGDGEPDGAFVGGLEGLESVPNGVGDETVRWFAYDRDGRVRLEELDVDGDGLVDARAIYVYDRDDRLEYKEWDGGADGTVEWRGRYVYDCWESDAP